MKRLGLLLLIVFFALLILNGPFVPTSKPGEPRQSLLKALQTKIEKKQTPANESKIEPTVNTVSAEFRNWFESEARNVEQEQKDALAVEGLLKERAQKLTPHEITFLKNKVLQSQVANEKIISVYMLSLAPEGAIKALAEITNQEPQFPSPQPTHSPEETLGMQEKALKRMAIDALFEKARLSPEARQLFRENIDKIVDPELRAYAQRKDQELP